MALQVVSCCAGGDEEPSTHVLGQLQPKQSREITVGVHLVLSTR